MLSRDYTHEDEKKDNRFAFINFLISRDILLTLLDLNSEGVNSVGTLVIITSPRRKRRKSLSLSLPCCTLN